MFQLNVYISFHIFWSFTTVIHDFQSLPYFFFWRNKSLNIHSFSEIIIISLYLEKKIKKSIRVFVLFFSIYLNEILLINLLLINLNCMSSISYVGRLKLKLCNRIFDILEYTMFIRVESKSISNASTREFYSKFIILKKKS